jgi:hypothetical protein
MSPMMQIARRDRRLEHHKTRIVMSGRRPLTGRYFQHCAGLGRRRDLRHRLFDFAIPSRTISSIAHQLEFWRPWRSSNA